MSVARPGEPVRRRSAVVRPPGPPRHAEGAASAVSPRGTRRRLDHIDAMRPVKQLGVLGTHSVIAYAHGIFFGAALVLLHVSREGFLFVSACMLTYAYRDLRLAGLGTFWRRRAVLVVVPYLTWTVIYFAIGLPDLHGSVLADLGQLLRLSVVGYSQLYFIVVLVQFYVVFPLVLALLRRTEGHHRLLVVLSVAAQLAYTGLMHWGLLPGWLAAGTTATRELVSYQFYLLAGCVAAWHYEAFHAWIVRHGRLIVCATVGTGALAEAWYFLAQDNIVHGLGSNSSDPFMPVVLPFNVSAIALIYLIGVWLVKPRRSGALRRFAHFGSDNSFAIYLSQVAFLDALSGLGWGRLDQFVPWPVTVVGAVVLVFAAGCGLGALFARLPGARGITGRSREPWPWARRGGDDQRDQRDRGESPPPLGSLSWAHAAQH
jgi:peptidoglycan/LPS O-acetylase OafA/YrhL